MVEAKYDWQRIAAPDKQIVEQLSQELGINPVIARLLAERGITTPEEAHSVRLGFRLPRNESTW